MFKTIKTTTKLLLLTSSLALGSTIPVTGFGDYSLDNYYDTYANYCMTGEGIATCGRDIRIGPAPPTSLSQLTKLDVSGDIQITSFQEFGTRFIDGKLNTDWWSRGTFTICHPVSVPEPASGWLLGLGFVMLIAGYLAVRFAKGK